MSVADEIARLVAAEKANAAEDRDQLQELEEAEEVLRSIGVNLEPKFDISLRSRIGARIKPDA